MKITRVLTGAFAAFFAVQGYCATVWTGNSSTNWSDGGNWTVGLPGVSESVAAVNSTDKDGIVNIDIIPTNVVQLRFYSNVSTNFTFSGETLTLLSGEINPIGNASAFAHTFNNDVVIDTTGGVRRPSVGTAGLIFNGGLTQVGDGDFEFVGGGPVEFNGKVTTTNSLELNGGGVYTFGNTVSNEMEAITIGLDNAQVFVNTSSGVSFFDGGNIQVNNNNAVFTFNNANVMGDASRFTLGSAVTNFTAVFNADEDLGVISIVRSNATFNLVLGSNVTSLAFNDCAWLDWGENSELIITDFRPDVISFGSDSAGLNSNQLAAVTAYDTDGLLVAELELDESGFLTVPAPPVLTVWTGAADNSWTNPANWTAGVPGTDSATEDTRFGEYADNADNIVISGIAANPNLVWAQEDMATNFVISGETLTIDDNGDGSDALRNNSVNGYSVTWNNDIQIDGVGERVILSDGASVNAAQVFNGTVSASATKLTVRDGLVYFNDVLSVPETLQVEGETQAVFANTVSNAIDGLFVFSGFAGGVSEVIVNTTPGVNFYNGNKIQVNYDGKITFNSANVLGDSTHFTIAGSNTLTATFNADESLGRIFFPHTGASLHLILGDDVNEVAFWASSATTWGEGASVVISNFMPGVIRFGTTAAGMTTEQMAVTTAYDWSGAEVTNLDIDSNGYLIGDISDPTPPEVGEISFGLLSGSDEIVISWMSSNAASYAVETTTNLVTGPWVDVSTDIIGSGGSMSVTDAVDNAAAFYRVYSY